MSKRRTAAIDALRRWGIEQPHLEPPVEGANSSVWRVPLDGPKTYILKLAEDGSEADFEAGLRAAEALEAVGFPAGGPIRTLDQRLFVRTPLGPMALLTEITGRPADPATEVDLASMGHILARAHGALRVVNVEVPETQRWPWRWPALALAESEAPSDVTAAVHDVLAEAEAVSGPLTHGTLHGDPAPDAFRLDGSRDHGALIDWATLVTGPLLYDLASVGVLTYENTIETRFETFVNAYLESGLVNSREVNHLPIFVRVRWAAHAVYYASRIHRGIVRGPDAEGANERGLRRALEGMRR